MACLIRKKRKLDEVMSSSASTSLTDLSDELLALILGNLVFCKRSVTRRVCRTLCRVADSLPPPQELRVEFSRSEENLAEAKWGHHLGECNDSVTNLEILLDRPQIGAEAEYLLQLRAIRPVQLKLGAFSGISSQLLRRVVDQVAGTVSSLSIKRLETESPLALYDAFSPFRNNGCLTHLHLEDFAHSRSVLFAISTLTSLVRLDLVITESSFPEWEYASSEQTQGFGLELTALQSLPSLRELSIHFSMAEFVSADFLTGLTLGFSAMHQIWALSCEFLFDDTDLTEGAEETYQAFALMLCRLDNLKELSKLWAPSEVLWSHVHRVGGHSKLKNYSIDESEAEELELEATVRAIVQDFPALVTLELELTAHNLIQLDRTSEILAGLRCHSSMTDVAVFLESESTDVDASQVDDFLRMLQKDLRPQISVTAFLPE